MSSNPWLDFRQKAVLLPRRTIVLAEGEDQRVIAAAAQAKSLGVADPLLIGASAKIDPLWKALSTEPVPCVDPMTLSTENLASCIALLRATPKNKALSDDEAKTKVQDPLNLGCLLVKRGDAHGFIGGATRTSADTLRSVFTILGLGPGASTMFGLFLIEPVVRRDDALILLADCAVVPDPSAKQLCNIAIGSAAAYKFFTGQEPRIAFLSFSTAGSAAHEQVDKVRQARDMARAKAPELLIEGEWQADAALDIFTAGIKGVSGSAMAGKANVLIAPDLNTGNIGYKMVQRLGGCRAVGPVLWGTAKPANDLSRGCSADDILDMIALTSLQAQTISNTN